MFRKGSVCELHSSNVHLRPGASAELPFPVPPSGQQGGTISISVSLFILFKHRSCISHAENDMPDISLVWAAPSPNSSWNPHPITEEVFWVRKEGKIWMSQGKRMIPNSFMVENTLKSKTWRLDGTYVCKRTACCQRALHVQQLVPGLLPGLVLNIYNVPTSDTPRLGYTLEIFHHMQPSRNLSV